MEEKRDSLAPSEWRVMECLWTGPKTLMELVRALKDSAGWAKSTVTTMVRRMEEKGLIGYETTGRTKVFRAALAGKTRRRRKPTPCWSGPFTAV